MAWKVGAKSRQRERTAEKRRQARFDFERLQRELAERARDRLRDLPAGAGEVMPIDGG